MKLLIVLMCISSSTYSMSFNQAQKIYQRLAISHSGREPIMVYNPSHEINASGSRRVIVMNQGMLDFVKNDHEMAMIIGHELGHANGIGSGMRNETRADVYGAYVTEGASYSRCTGGKVLKRMSGGGHTHPVGLERYKALNC